ncbi:MAG: T9SS type A sorting domain-containing protein, partial [Bacteroidia bacterium]|nr:T9SS type A sorting domain-containing protein [Bacteroidia bacterium]
AGTYTVNFQLDEGHGGPPCTPGIVPGPTMGATFTVSIPTSVANTELFDNSFVVYPNPVVNEITISNKQLTVKSIEIYNVFGQSVFQSQNSDYTTLININVSEFAEGIYFVKVGNEIKQQVIKMLKK